MIEYDVKDKVLYGVSSSNDEKIINIPNDVERIKHLKIAKNIEKLIIPSSVKSIDLDAFEYAINLLKIELIDNDNFIIEKKCLYDNNKKTIYLAERDISGRITIPLQVSNISAHAFAHCSGLTQVKLIQGIKHIGSFAFIECYNLEKINIPSLYDLDLKEATFEGCSKLREITIPKNIISFGKCLFYECWELEKINIETSKIRIIPIQCFAYCESLIRIDFNDGLEEIQENAFIGCESMTEASFPSSVNKIGSSIFVDDNNLTVFSNSRQLANYCSKYKIMFEYTD